MGDEKTDPRKERRGILERGLSLLLFLAAGAATWYVPDSPRVPLIFITLAGGLLPADRLLWRMGRYFLLSLAFWLLLRVAWVAQPEPGWPVALSLAGWAFVLGRFALMLPRTGGHRSAMVHAGLGMMALLMETGAGPTDTAAGMKLILIGLYAVGWRLVLRLPEAALAALAPALAAVFVRLLALAEVLPVDYLVGSEGFKVLAGAAVLFIAAEQALSGEREYPFRHFVFWRGLLPMLAPMFFWTPDGGDPYEINAARYLVMAIATGSAYIIAGNLVRASVLRDVGRTMWWGSLMGLAILIGMGDPYLGTAFITYPTLPGFLASLDVASVFTAAVALGVISILVSTRHRVPPPLGYAPAWLAAGFAFFEFGLWHQNPFTFPGLIAGCLAISLAASRHRLFFHRLAWATGILLPALMGWDAREFLSGLVLVAASLLPGVVVDRFGGGPVSPETPDTPTLPPASAPTAGSTTV